jgi:hypothetical protein
MVQRGIRCRVGGVWSKSSLADDVDAEGIIKTTCICDVHGWTRCGCGMYMYKRGVNERHQNSASRLANARGAGLAENT